MTKDEFKSLEVGDYVQVTSHGQNKGKIGFVAEILRHSLGSGSVYLKPYNREFGFTNKYSKREKNGLASFSHGNVKYLGKSPIIPTKRITFEDIDITTEKGRFILMALAHITGVTHSNMTLEQTIDDLYDTYYETMFGV